MTTDIASLAPRCDFCNDTRNLLLCSRCKVILYCNREHQAANRAAHKSACNTIARATALVGVEEQKLRNHPGDILMDPNPFENSVGHFWGIIETRDYMRARFALTEALQKVKTRHSAQAQLDHFMDMLRLCRSDNLGVRWIVPGLMLRLKKDQECYDFVKWWNITGERGDYDWGDMDLPHLDIKNADVFESVEYLCGEFIDLHQKLAIALLKIKLMIDLTALTNSGLVGHKVPQEILDRIKTHIALSPIITENKDIMERKDHTAVIEELITQVHMLYGAVENANQHFWPALLNPGTHLNARPDTCSRGTIEEMQLALMYSYDSWIETPGAIEEIKVLQQDTDR
jgi:hypothetical protein